MTVMANIPEQINTVCDVIKKREMEREGET